MTTKQTLLPEQAPSIISYSSDGMDDEDMMESFALEDEPNNEYLSDTLPSSTSNDDRDEVKEIRKLSTQETRKVRCWRVLVFFMLVCTAVAVTLTSYFLLTREEDNKFETAFYQFARTVGDSALAHQRDVRASFASLASALTVGAEVANATWPFYYLPKFESFAEDTS